ncbi:MAG: hypothetical protein QOF51_2980, partial [Chloroflexota bacterium]|nr:hypothetical protein [Chloroflexota bacterium]
MAIASNQPQTTTQITITQTVLPAGDGSHGTPDPVLKRVFTFKLPQGEAEVTQTDYGHPGRMNPCYPQRIPGPLQ